MVGEHGPRIYLKHCVSHTMFSVLCIKSFVNMYTVSLESNMFKLTSKTLNKYNRKLSIYGKNPVKTIILKVVSDLRHHTVFRTVFDTM